MKPVQKRSLQTQARILETSRKLFEAEGCENVTAEMIATEAGVAKGTVFAHFQDRSNLIAAVGMQEMQEAVCVMERRAADTNLAPLVDRVLALYEPLLTLFSRNSEFARLFINQSTFDEGPWSTQFRNSCESFEETLTDCLEREKSQKQCDVDARLLAEGAQAFFLQIVTYRIAGWIKDDEAAQQKFKSYLKVWLVSM
ncbi:MAG: TetR/AcrR family transcriptional regulator [Sneathiella sp.]